MSNLPEKQIATVWRPDGTELAVTTYDIGRLLTAIRRLPNGCIEWTGCVSSNGYGTLRIQGTQYGAHRVAYMLSVGQIPPGMHVDHLCRHRLCVNPVHLEVITSRLNTMRSPIAPAAVNSRKTHCDNGHEYTPENTYVRPGTAHRRCRICRRQWEREWTLRRAV